MSSRDTDIFLRELGSRIAEARKRKGWTQGHLAGLLSCPVPTWRNYEQGQSSIPLPRIVEASKRLEVSIDWLLMGVSYGDSARDVRPSETSVFAEFVDSDEMLQRFRPSSEELLELKSAAKRDPDLEVLDLVARLAAIRKGGK